MVDLFVSSFSQARATRAQILKLQSSYTAAQSELSTGRVSDVARTLGHKVGQFSALESRIGVIDSVMASSSVLKSRLEAVELAIGGIREASSEFKAILVGARGGVVPHGDLADHARSFLEKAQLLGNTTHGGRYVLSGSNGDQPALRDFLSADSDARTALATSFADVFNIGPSDPDASGISRADMKSWLDTGFAALFGSENWNNVWSASSGSPVEARIGDREIATIPAAVSDPSFRKIVMASVLMLEFGGGRVGSEAFAEVLDSADALMDEGLSGLINFEASNGSLMSRIDAAGEALMLQKQIYTSEVSEMVEVDPAEVSLRIESLRARLEASYATTARLSRLSLVNYI